MKTRVMACTCTAASGKAGKARPCTLLLLLLLLPCAGAIASALHAMEMPHAQGQAGSLSQSTPTGRQLAVRRH